MRVLVLGSGAREHALVWKLSHSKLCSKIFCIPGNGGITEQAECINLSLDNFEELVTFARKEKITLTIVGPEAPLAAGIVDIFKQHKLAIFGPNKKAAQLEASKVFAKFLMKKYNIPTASFEVFDNPEEAKKYIDKFGAPCVVKADGLASGKGVVVAKTKEEAIEAVTAMMEKKIFGNAANKVIIEECLSGQEASILVFTDSREVIPLASSQDHKRVFDNDQGPNTGGMGAYSPTPLVSHKLFQEILEKIIYRTIDGIIKEGIVYQGVLYAGIMITKDGPKVLEFNVRFGDPETQAIIPRLRSDLLETMLATAFGTLSKVKRSGGLNWDSRYCSCVVCASGGYPGVFEKGKIITGLEEAQHIKDVLVFHAGTCIGQQQSDGKKVFLTSGGRVLSISGLGRSLREALQKTYQAVEKIHFEGIHYRRDIGAKALAMTS
ncbi:MAG: phosphoribosylamine--glycine ligase [Candidatus Omnitrophica bacterium]|nr:phosphoribosylamine--glycine ligase [Candidatus Omnitrophota bacterium]